MSHNTLQISDYISHTHHFTFAHTPSSPTTKQAVMKIFLIFAAIVAVALCAPAQRQNRLSIAQVQELTEVLSNLLRQSNAITIQDIDGELQSMWSVLQQAEVQSKPGKLVPNMAKGGGGADTAKSVRGGGGEALYSPPPEPKFFSSVPEPELEHRPLDTVPHLPERNFRPPKHYV